MKRVLMIGAHFDDVELGAGGTAAWLSDRGTDVFKLTLTDNVTCSDHLGLDVDHESSKSDSASAAEILNVKELSYEYDECGQLSYSTAAMQKVESIVFEYEIDTVFLHLRDDVNQDHAAASVISATAARHCRSMFCYQSNLYVMSTPFYPTVFVDISGHVERKREALRQYGGQHDRFGKLFATTIQRNAVWGAQVGTEYAEAFVPVKHVLGG